MKVKKILTQVAEEKSEKKHFDEKARVYDKQYGYDNVFTKYKIRKKSLEFVNFVKKNYSKKDIKILEIGCGTGEYTKLVSRYLPDVRFAAIDISPKSVTIAKKKCGESRNVTFSVQSAYKTSYKSQSFDFVFGFYILHHLDIKKIGGEVYRVLKKGGKGFFYEPNILNPYVFMVKSNKLLKERVGDSPDEWAINPLTISNILPGFEVDCFMSEFILPSKSFSLKTLVALDKATSVFGKVPFLKYLGGSTQIRITKS